jgi:hypothetical protein
VPELSPEDQRKVDDFVKSNVNSVDRKPFRPLMLLGYLFVILAAFTCLAFFIASSHGVV